MSGPLGDRAGSKALDQEAEQEEEDRSEVRSSAGSDYSEGAASHWSLAPAHDRGLIDEVVCVSREVGGPDGEDWTKLQEEEGKWAAESLRQNMLLGAKLLAVMNGCQLLYIVWALLTRILFGCSITPFFGTTCWNLRVEAVCFFITTSCFVACVKYPHVYLYCGSLFFWLAVLLVAFLHRETISGDADASHSCSGLRWVSIVQFRNGTDGFDMLQASTIFILLTPLVVPRLSMMKYYLGLWCLAFCMLAARQLIALPHVALWLYGDALAGLCFIVILSYLAVRSKRSTEQAQRMQMLLHIRQRDLSANLFRILGYMVPSFLVVPMLRNPGSVIAAHVDRASIMFIVVEDFDRIAHDLSAHRLLCFLNSVFTHLDGICASRRVTKIETIGAEYVCAVGVVPEDQEEDSHHGHQGVLGRLVSAALDVVELPQKCLKGSVTFRLGIHTGPVVAGVVGQKLPRFRLFGDTVNTAARLMQKGLPGEVQLSSETRDCLPAWAGVTRRGLIHLKGKGEVPAYLLQHRASTSASAHHAAVAAGDEAEASTPSAVPVSPRWSLCSTGGCGTVEAASSPKSVDTTATRRFERVLSMMRVEHNTEIKPEAQSKACWSWTGFTQAEEEGFQQWFHSEYICKNLADRLNKQAFFVLALTLGELGPLLCYARLGDDSLGMEELFSFLGFRVGCLGIILLFRVVAGFRAAIQESRCAAQGMLLLATCGFAILLFRSYSVLGFQDSRQMKECQGDLSAGRFGYTICGIKGNIVLLACFPVYVLATTAYPFRFRPSLFLPLLVPVILALETPNADENKIFQSFFFKFFFFMRPIWCPFEAYLREACLRERYKSMRLVESTHDRINGILTTLLPPMVLDDLRLRPLSPPQHEYSRATVAQSDLSGFTRLASTRRPQEVVEIIGDLFGRFDALTDLHGVYKVETVGDAYIAGQAEKPLTARNSPIGVVCFALAMVEAVREWSASRNEGVSCRVGVHFGKCVGGVVGKGMQRYHLFGELLTLLEVLEATAPEGGVQVSGACKEAVDQEVADGALRAVVLRLRGDVSLVTSKGEACGYDKTGGRTYLAYSGLGPPCPPEAVEGP